MKTLAKGPVIFGQASVNENVLDSIGIKFSNLDSINGGEKDTLFILATLKADAPNRSFSFVLGYLNAFEVSSEFPIQVVDPNGLTLDQSNEISSPKLAVINSNIEKTYLNYPNPFGQNAPETKFVFFLEDDADVEIHILTLTGQLVRHLVAEGLGRGLQDGVLRWDGKNDRGFDVVNGVYLARVHVKYKNGSSFTKILKVLYIK